jgi:hypothetical protein
MFRLFKKPRPKVFCIGHNKTGTTTLERVLKDFGYRMGSQVKGELFIDDWYNRDFKRIVKFAKSADAFQDIPFSLPETYKHLDAHFKDARFILTERDSAEQWYDSLTTFHSKMFAGSARVPLADDLKKAKYRYEGYVFKAFQYIYNTPEDDLYKKETLMRFYMDYNAAVKHYFSNRAEQLLCINVSKPSDYAKLCEFLNQPKIEDDFPWENKT